MRPFLKWAGGKYRVLTRIRALLPPGARLVEPFVGSGAVFLNTEYPAALLADLNPDLISLYAVLQRHGPAFIDAASKLFGPDANTPDRYYAARTRFNASRDVWERAVLFVYLNRHGYNGLCRYNAAGEFNVPFGRYRRPYFPAEEMRAFWERSRSATFVGADFREVMAGAVPGDVVYCDPPYVPLSPTANFTDYAAGGFGARDQEDLATLAVALARRGVPVLISNHDTPTTRRLYGPAQLERFAVQRSISRDGHNRGAAAELLALFAKSPL
jgi:DNA adenine methylase